MIAALYTIHKRTGKVSEFHSAYNMEFEHAETRLEYDRNALEVEGYQVKEKYYTDKAWARQMTPGPRA
jgi:hypothetical protein